MRAARRRARVLGDAEGRDAQPGPELQGTRHGDGGGRRPGAKGRRGWCARAPGTSVRRWRTAARVEAWRSPSWRRRTANPLKLRQIAALRRRHPARGRGHRRRAAAGAGDRGGGRRLPGRGQPGPRDLRGRRHDRARARPRRSGARRRARGARRRRDGQRRGLRHALARRATWR